MQTHKEHASVSRGQQKSEADLPGHMRVGRHVSGEALKCFVCCDPPALRQTSGSSYPYNREGQHLYYMHMLAKLKPSYIPFIVLVFLSVKPSVPFYCH